MKRTLIFYFFLLIGAIFLSGNSMAQSLEPYNWEEYHFKFKIPTDFNVTESSGEKFIASNDDFNLSIYPQTGKYMTAQEMQDGLEEWSKSNDLKNTTEIKLLDSDKLNGLFGYFIEGEKDGNPVFIMIFQDLAYSEIYTYVWLYYPEGSEDDAVEILTSFAPIEGDDDVELSEDYDYDDYSSAINFSDFPEAVMIDPGEIYSTYNVEDDGDAMAAIREAVDYDNDDVDYVLGHINEENWPEGFKTLDERTGENNFYFHKLQYYKLAEFDDKSILVAPMEENENVGSGVITFYEDMFIVISTSAIKVNAVSSSSVNMDYSSFPEVIVTDAAEIYSTWDISDVSSAMSALKSALDYNTAKVSYVMKHIQEDGWPSGLKTLDDREANRHYLYRMKLYKICSFSDSDGDYLILAAPKSDNEYVASDDLTFYDDMFIIIKKSATKMK
jgi:hypothetical protein